MYLKSGLTRELAFGGRGLIRGGTTDKRTSLWWEGPYKGETTVVRTSLWWEWPYKGGPTVVRTSYLFNNFAEI